MESIEKVAKVANNFYCEICDYTCSKKFNFNKHLETEKHKKLFNQLTSNNKVAEVVEPEEVIKYYKCDMCNKEYKCYSGLWRHKKVCKFEEPTCEEIEEEIEDSNEISYKDMFLTMVNENKEMRNMIIEQQKLIVETIPKVGNNNNNTNNTVNNNQRFNINVFLNEKCKDAMNISDFIKSIEVSLEQLDLTKSKGLEAGITSVIMENMSNLSVYERPIHCTDTKRETLYIKDGDKWEKDRDKSKIKHVIKKTSGKNYDALVKWTKENPDFMDSDDKQRYYALALSKLGKPLEGVDDKVIKKICSNTYLKESLEDEEMLN
tara:strand:+ start:611 stop:1567 length:957 start_codon:yes stop_codon:yes gene_type:complete